MHVSQNLHTPCRQGEKSTIKTICPFTRRSHCLSVPTIVNQNTTTPAAMSQPPKASFRMPPTKKRRFMAQNLVITRDTETNPNSDLIATVRRWGSTLTIFPDGSTGETLWQLQIQHNPPQRINGLGSQLLATVRDALQNYPDSNIRDIKALEEQEKILIYNGGPGQNTDADPDKVGMQPWQAVIYVGGNDPNRGLDFIHFLLTHKLRKGQLIQMPKLIVACKESLSVNLPPAWELSEQATIQKPFSTVPPKQRRHIMCQLEIKESEEQGDQPISDAQTIPDSDAEEGSDTTYILSLFGGMYGYREVMDNANIAGGYIELEESSKREYVRLTQFRNDQDGKTKIRSLLEEVLCHLPLYFIDGTDKPNDPFAQWLRQQPSIVPSEKLE